MLSEKKKAQIEIVTKQSQQENNLCWTWSPYLQSQKEEAERAVVQDGWSLERPKFTVSQDCMKHLD